jgi:putative inorganic carbon (hco3(-)) transporter
MIFPRWLPAISGRLSLLIVAVAAFIAVAPPLYSAAAILVAVTVAVSLARPTLALAALAVAVPFGSVLDVRGDALPLGAAEAMALLAVASWLAAVLARRDSRIELGPLFWPLAAIVGAGILSASFADDYGVSAKELLRWVELLLVYLAATNILRDMSRLRLLIAAVLAAASAEALVGVVQFFTRIGPPSFQMGPFLRAYGTFGQPNPFGGYLGMALPLALALVVGWRPRGRDWLWYAALGALGLTSAALAMSLSRGAWLGVAFAALLVAALVSRRAAGAAVGILVLGALTLSLNSLNILPDFIAQRVTSVSGYFGVFDARGVYPYPDIWAIVERMAHWQAGWEMMLDHPLVGVGPGHYPVAYPDYAILPFWKDALGHAQNIYLNIGAEMGLIGLLAYLAALGSWISVALRTARAWRVFQPAGFGRALGIGIAACLTAAAVHNLFDNLYVHAMNVHVALLLGALAACRGLVPVTPPARGDLHC